MSKRTLGDPTFGGPGYALVELTLQTILRYEMVTSEDSVVVAFSGGPDSTCLLDVMARLQDKLDITLVVAHVDHRLSEGSAEVSARVAHAAAQAGFEVHVAKAPDLSGANLHARARDFRYEFMDIIAAKEEARWVATGHTLDDRVETLLARLIHGAGTSGLAGIPPVGGNRIRPLIASRRSETRAYCDECGLDYFDDPSNEDPRFDRSSVRSEIVAAIEKRWGDGAVRAIATSAERLNDDASALDDLTEKLYPTMAETTDEGTRLDRTQLGAVSRAFRRRVLERAVGRVRDRSGGIDAALDALEAPDAAVPGARFAVASGIEIEIQSDHVLIRGHA